VTTIEDLVKNSQLTHHELVAYGVKTEEYLTDAWEDDNSDRETGRYLCCR